MRRLPVILSALVALLLTVTAVAPAAGPPSATTGAASAVGQTTATLGGTVTPGGSPTTWYVRYGTTTAYGARTAEGPVDGSAPVAVSTAVSGLAAGRTYHFELVAANAAGEQHGGDQTFRTTATPRVYTDAARPGVDGATLRGRVDARGQATTYFFEYGTSTRYGSQTAEAQATTVSGLRAVTAGIAGLSAYTTYHVRLVARNATGVTRGPDRTFRTLRHPTGVTISLDRATVPWAATAVVSGRVAGEGVSRIGVELQRQDFPFGRGFRREALAAATTDGRFRFTTGPLWETTQLRVVTRTTVAAASQILTVPSALVVGLRGAAPTTTGRAAVTGSVRPAAPGGQASLQRQSASGRWVTVARTGLTPLPGNRSRYAFSVTRSRTAAFYRVVVVPNDGGAHARGASRERALRVR